MARPSPQLSDPRLLKPVIEALIFASEEPLPARTLVRLLLGEREDEESSPEVAAADSDRTDPPDAPDSEEAPSSQRDAVNGDARALASAYEDVRMHSEEAEGALETIDVVDQRLVRRMVDGLNEEYDETGRAFRIVELAGGFQFATLREYGEYIALLSRERQRRRLSPAALETLSIIAYRQPIAKPEIEAIRGVNSDQVLLSLLEKNLIAITGRSETVGRPLLYGTTDDFLRCFGLNTLNDLPKLREIEELMEEDAYSAEKIEVVNVPESSEAAEIEALVGAAGTLVDERDLREAAATGRVPAEREHPTEEDTQGAEDLVSSATPDQHENSTPDVDGGKTGGEDADEPSEIAQHQRLSGDR